MRKQVMWVLLSALLVALVVPAMAVPPPWAPAHGWRRKQARRVYVRPVATSFVYGGLTYVPLRDVASLIGAALLWNSLERRALITYNGREIGLLIGSPRVYYDDEWYGLAGPPLLVQNVIYVPEVFCTRYLKVPTRHERGALGIRGPSGWRDFRIASRPPGRIHVERRQGRGRPEVRGRGRGVTPRGWERRERQQIRRGREIERGRGMGHGREMERGRGVGHGNRWGGEGRGRGRGGQGGGGHGRGRGHGD